MSGRGSRRTTSRYFSARVGGAAEESASSSLEVPKGARRKKTPRDGDDLKPEAAPPKKKKRTASNGSPPAATAAKVGRTNSFGLEPAWWGNVVPSSGRGARHPHASASAAASSASSPAKSPAPDGPPPADAFPPVHTLILGTHPSVQSLSRNEMYGHPLNAFWYIAGDALGFRRSAAVSPKTGKPYANLHDELRHDNVVEYPRQLELLTSRGFAVWDIVAECEREGSLDADIKQEVPNPIREWCEGRLRFEDSPDDLRRCLEVKRIVIANDTTGAKFFVRHFSSWFENGKLVASSDEMSQRALKSAMNRARKANPKLDEDAANGGLIEVCVLPGVSPAAARFSYAEKRTAWEAGCYGPGLRDYEEWKARKTEAAATTPAKRKRAAVTPAADKGGGGSPRKTPRKSPSKSPAVRVLSSSLAAISPENEWIDLKVDPGELRPSATLTNGQCFNWIVVDVEEDAMAPDTPNSSSAWGVHDAKEWVGPLGGRVVCIRETPATTLCRVLRGPVDGIVDELRSYFRLETPLLPLYGEWSKSDARLAKIAPCIPGCRILRQDPVECLFSFICSSNNNIPRITKLLASLREEYGGHLVDIPTRTDDGVDGSMSLYSFPSLESLSAASEDGLRDLGLGYRARYIVETRDLLAEKGGAAFLLGLRAVADARAVQDELTEFAGVGRKVADCVALFSLDQDAAIPVDVHVQHIASRDYDPTVLGGAKSLTPRVYGRVGDLFRDRFGERAGWAHSLLFVAELPSFRPVLPSDVVGEMDEWREREQAAKRGEKAKKKKQG